MTATMTLERMNQKVALIEMATGKHPRTIVNPDGTHTMTFTPEQLVAIEAMIADRIWWQGAWSRVNRISGRLAFVLAALMTVSLWWPWITRIAQFLLQDVPGR